MIGFNDDIEKMLDFNKLSKEEFLQSYSYLTEEEYDATMVETIRCLMKKTPDGIVYDADTILADIVYKADVVTGLAMELLSIWEKSTDKNAIEDFFYALTDVTFDEFLMRCKNTLQGDNETLHVVSGLEEPRENDECHYDLQIVRAETLPSGWNWRMYNDGSGSLRNSDGKSYFSYDISTQEYRIDNAKEYNFMPNYPLDTPFAEFQKFAEKYIITNILEPEDLSDFFIIENDPNKDYGISFVWRDDYEYKINMYQDRFIPAFWANTPFGDALDKFEETATNYGADKSQICTVCEIINQHMNWWMNADLTEEQIKSIPIYPMSEMQRILENGFFEERIIITI